MRRTVVLLFALAMLLCLAGCKGKDEPASSLKRPDMEALKAAKVGSYIFFGEYEQDNDESTGKEAIEWLVLDKREDKMFVISRYGLVAQPYNTEDDDITWENCTLRKWLNDTFYEDAFISEEKNLILVSTVRADPNPICAVSSGNDTMDHVFLLSFVESDRYFADDDARSCRGTPYGKASGLSLREEGCWWWLRSPGGNSDRAAYISFDGSDSYIGDYVDCEYYAVRPAMWIKLNP